MLTKGLLPISETEEPGPSTRAVPSPVTKRPSVKLAESPSSLTSAPPLTVMLPSPRRPTRSEEHTSELQSLMRISYAVFCLKKTKKLKSHHRYRSYNPSNT